MYGGIRGNIFYFSKAFSGTDIYHSKIKKNALLQIKVLFMLTKNHFSKFAKFFKTNACEIVIFSSICRKN